MRDGLTSAPFLCIIYRMTSENRKLTEDVALAALEAAADCIEEDARLRARRVVMEDYRKVIKAKLMAKSPAKSIQQREMDAYANRSYKRYLVSLMRAIEEDEIARLRRADRMATFEAWRTIAANKRAEAKI